MYGILNGRKLNNQPMIQRIQSFYLLVISILSGFTIFSTVADLISVSGNLHYLMNFKGISLIQPTGTTYVSSTWLLSTFGILFGIIALITLFSFKNRIRQIRLSVVNMIFMIGYYIVLLVSVWSACNRLNTDWHLHLSTSFPLICLILNYLAIGAIGKDENLVKSTERLR
jgi:hypothetical protein